MSDIEHEFCSSFKGLATTKGYTTGNAENYPVGENYYTGKICNGLEEGEGNIKNNSLKIIFTGKFKKGQCWNGTGMRINLNNLCLTHGTKANTNIINLSNINEHVIYYFTGKIKNGLINTGVLETDEGVIFFKGNFNEEQQANGTMTDFKIFDGVNYYLYSGLVANQSTVKNYTLHYPMKQSEVKDTLGWPVEQGEVKDTLGWPELKTMFDCPAEQSEAKAMFDCPAEQSEAKATIDCPAEQSEAKAMIDCPAEQNEVKAMTNCSAEQNEVSHILKNLNNKIVYVGSLCDKYKPHIGKCDGYPYKYSKNKDEVYTGNIHNGMLDGEGTLQTSTGRIFFTGFFKYDMILSGSYDNCEIPDCKNGLLLLTTNVKNGQKNGNVIITSFNDPEKIIYNGEYNQNVPSDGYSDGVYICNYEVNTRNRRKGRNYGIYTFNYNTEGYYTGMLKNGQQTGMGELKQTYNNTLQTVYTGEFINGVIANGDLNYLTMRVLVNSQYKTMTFSGTVKNNIIHDTITATKYKMISIISYKLPNYSYPIQVLPLSVLLDETDLDLPRVKLEVESPKNSYKRRRNDSP